MAAKPIMAKINLSKMRWERIYQTSHFIFFITKNSLFKKSDASKCEKHFLKVHKTFHFSPNWENKIKVYIVPDRNAVQRIVGRKTFGCVIGMLSLISVYAFHPHEITHIIFNKHLGDSHYIFKEGTAVLYGWFKRVPLWRGKKLSFWMRKFKKDKSRPSFRKLFCEFNNIDSKISYPLSGAFVDFLIIKYGVKNFTKIYKKINKQISYKKIEAIFKQFTEESLEKLEEEFWRKF